MMQYALAVLLIVSPTLLQGAPQEPAAVAAEPVAVPTAVAAPPAPAAVATPVRTSPAVTDPAGGGIITEHKNPDGSTITVTRYNGPLPANAFQNPLGLTGLHDIIHQNLYQNQLFHLQTQQAINDALLRNFNAFNYNFPATYGGFSPIHRYSSSYMFPYNSLATTALGGHGFFMPTVFSPYGFFPFGQQPVASRTI